MNDRSGDPKSQFRALVAALAGDARRSYVFADLLDLLGSVTKEQFAVVVSELPRAELDAYALNYLAAMIEQVAASFEVAPPPWVASIPPLSKPVFGSGLESLRLHLLLASPPPFCSRNIFIDAAVGDRV